MSNTEKLNNRGVCTFATEGMNFGCNDAYLRLLILACNLLESVKYYAIKSLHN